MAVGDGWDFFWVGLRAKAAMSPKPEGLGSSGVVLGRVIFAKRRREAPERSGSFRFFI